MTDIKKINWKKTLNLPKTAFSMRANLREHEPKSISEWKKTKLYDQILKKNSSGPEFILHDGPPYANGEIHAGHLLNKVLKDIVFRSKLMAGFKSSFIPGWDCHGLPIEYRVINDLKEKGKYEKIESLPDESRQIAIRRACFAYANKQMDGQRKQMERLLTLGDYENPYLTMQPEYESATLEVFAKIVEKGIVSRRRKPVHWSIANKTALAEAELEYKDREDISVYVQFPVIKESSVKLFGEKIQNIDLMIWTTTPWTLPANMAIAVGPNIPYSIVEIERKYVIVASSRISEIEKISKSTVCIKKEFLGVDLVGLKYKHPFCSRNGVVVSADYVTTEDGTGLVHTAPGHGVDDWQTGLRENIDIYCPVKEDGNYDHTVPEWISGKSIWDANQIIVEHLKDTGHLFHMHKFNHSYPHDGRSHTPVIFRATEQWFIEMDVPVKNKKTLRELAINAVENKISFTPDWGLNRLGGMLESRPDWCISRQRSWGLPIPAFRMSNGEILITPSTIRAVAQIFAKESSNAWFEKTPCELLKNWDYSCDRDAPEGVDINNLEKLNDIFDIWFEAGSSWAAVMEQRVEKFPSDLYLEGSDQHRGWFQLSLLPALAAVGEPPTQSIVTHGFVVDRNGYKMSKSLGNTVEVSKMIDQYGADVCRWWVTSLAYESDNRLDLEYLNVASESYRKIRNTLRFLLSNLEGYEIKESKLEYSSETLEAWLLSECSNLYKAVLESYKLYSFRKVHQSIYDFCNETLSSIYCAAVKDRLYCDAPDALRRQRAQGAMFEVLKTVTTLVAPILPHTADEIWKIIFGASRTVHVENFQEVFSNADQRWPEVIKLREKILKLLEKAKERGIENSLDAGIRVPENYKNLDVFEDDIVDLCGISRIEWVESSQELEIIDLRESLRCERSWKRDATVQERPNGRVLSERDWQAIQKIGLLD